MNPPPTEHLRVTPPPARQITGIPAPEEVQTRSNPHDAAAASARRRSRCRSALASVDHTAAVTGTASQPPVAVTSAKPVVRTMKSTRSRALISAAPR